MISSLINFGLFLILLGVYHVQGIAAISGKNFAFEHVEVPAVLAVLSLAPGGSCTFLLQTPVYGKHRRQDVKFIAGNEHLVHLQKSKPSK